MKRTFEQLENTMERMPSKQAALAKRRAELKDLWERLRSEESYLTAEHAKEVLEFFFREGLIRASDLETLEENQIDEIGKKLKSIPRKRLFIVLRPKDK